MASAPKIRFGTGTTVRDFAVYAEWLRVGEDCGYELLTTGDSQSLWADPFVIMTVAASRTTRPRLAITVSNPMTRHPAVVASSATALQQISGGRFVYGISSGDSALRNIGVLPASVAELEEYVTCVQAMCDGRPATFRGQAQQLRWDHRPTPVWMAAEGPRTLRLAGRIAQGVVLSNSLTAEAMQRNLSHIREGAEQAGRSLDDLEIWCMANVVPAASEAEGIDQVRSVLAGTANHVFRFTVDGKGLPEELVPKVEELKRRYDSSHHASPETAAHNAALVDELGLTSWLARQSTIAGPIEHCIERLHEVAAAGVKGIIVAQFVPDQLNFMRTFADKVLPEFS
jgi:alkanesulfonate monooxygenase SsuD/methylene tetrahydromethanopterin reductase-like flavin-dependent oxidoreductase (luciferase family)